MIRDHMITSVHLDKGDLDYAPFDDKGGVGGTYQAFRNKMDNIIDEMNEALAA